MHLGFVFRKQTNELTKHIFRGFEKKFRLHKCFVFWFLFCRLARNHDWRIIVQYSVTTHLKKKTFKTKLEYKTYTFQVETWKNFNTVKGVSEDKKLEWRLSDILANYLHEGESRKLRARQTLPKIW